MIKNIEKVICEVCGGMFYKRKKPRVVANVCPKCQDAPARANRKRKMTYSAPEGGIMGICGSRECSNEIIQKPINGMLNIKLVHFCGWCNKSHKFYLKKVVTE